MTEHAVRRLRPILLGAALLLLPVVPAHASLPVQGAAATAAYWMRADGDVPLLSAEERTARERKSVVEGLLYDLVDAPQWRTGRTLRREVERAAQGLDRSLPEVYAGGDPLTRAAWDSTLDQRAIGEIGRKVRARPAVAVRRADVRLLPTDEGWYEDPDDVDYDLLQGTVLDPGEAVLVLHEAQDGRFVFVETRDYRGWVDARALADTDWKTWRTFAAPAEFFTVTTAQLRMDEGLHYQLGAQIPGRRAADGTLLLLLPKRDAEGHLAVQEKRKSDDGSLAVGRLPLTHNNLMRLAFAPLYTEYGWGGANEGMDCSSYVQNIYRAMGVDLPRDADMQERACSLLPLAGLSAAERYALLADVPPGSLLFRPGHVMLYLGRDAGGRPLVIHDISSYYADGEKQYIRQVVVSTLEFQNASGTAAIDTLDAIGFIAPAPWIWGHMPCGQSRADMEGTNGTL